MTLTTAYANVEMAVEVLSATLVASQSAPIWRGFVGDFSLEIAYSEPCDELVITHELLAKLPTPLPLEVLQRWERYAKRHLSPDVGVVAFDPWNGGLILTGRLALSEGDPWALALWLPMYLKACTAWHGDLAAIAPPEIAPRLKSAKQSPRQLALTL